MHHWQEIYLTSLLKGAHLAETLVVKLAQLWAYISLVVPVMSSHWAGAVPPETQQPPLCHSCPNKQGNRCLYSHFYRTFYVIFTSKKSVEEAPNNAMSNLAYVLFKKKNLIPTGSYQWHCRAGVNWWYHPPQHPGDSPSRMVAMGCAVQLDGEICVCVVRW